MLPFEGYIAFTLKSSLPFTGSNAQINDTQNLEGYALRETLPKNQRHHATIQLNTTPLKGESCSASALELLSTTTQLLFSDFGTQSLYEGSGLSDLLTMSWFQRSTRRVHHHHKLYQPEGFSTGYTGYCTYSTSTVLVML